MECVTTAMSVLMLYGFNFRQLHFSDFAFLFQYFSIGVNTKEITQRDQAYFALLSKLGLIFLNKTQEQKPDLGFILNVYDLVL
jgi:hypothetical protein